MALNLSPTPSLKISNYTSNSIAHQDRIAASTFAAGTNSRLKTIPSQKDRLCEREASTASWPPRRNSRADQENGRPTTSRWLDEWSPSCKMVRPLLTNRRFRASQVGRWIATKHSPDRSICRVVRPDTSLFGTSRLHHPSETATFSRETLRTYIRYETEQGSIISPAPLQMDSPRYPDRAVFRSLRGSQRQTLFRQLAKKFGTK